MALEPLSNPIDGLSISLRQTSASQPTVSVTVTNENPHPVTIVLYGSPLDDIALAQGLLSITPAGERKPLQLRTIKASRIWPPTPDDLSSLESGASATNEIVLKAPTVPMGMLGEKATVFLEGTWMGVFARPKHRVTPSDLEHMRSQPGAFTGKFKSESIEISIETKK